MTPEPKTMLADKIEQYLGEDHIWLSQTERKMVIAALRTAAHTPADTAMRETLDAANDYIR